jgi:hypothetical protein
VVRVDRVLGRKSSKRVHDGEPIFCFSISRYLIDFITGISDVSSGLPDLTVTPAWIRTPHPTSIPQTNRRPPTMGANVRMADDSGVVDLAVPTQVPCGPIHPARARSKQDTSG